VSVAEFIGYFVLALLAVAAVGSVVTWWATLGDYARGIRDRISDAARTEKRFAEVERIVRATRMGHDPRCTYARWRRLPEEEREAAEALPFCDCGTDLLHQQFNGYGVGGASLADGIKYDTREYLPGERPAGHDPPEDEADEEQGEP